MRSWLTVIRSVAKKLKARGFFRWIWRAFSQSRLTAPALDLSLASLPLKRGVVQSWMRPRLLLDGPSVYPSLFHCAVQPERAPRTSLQFRYSAQDCENHLASKRAGVDLLAQ
jgi:hypothetical protein